MERLDNTSQKVETYIPLPNTIQRQLRINAIIDSERASEKNIKH